MQFDEIVISRRAVNFFDESKDVPDQLIRRMVEMASRTPSSFNLQPWSLIILREKEDKERLQKCAMNQPKVSQAPVTMIVLADRDGWKEGHPFVERAFAENIKAGTMTGDQRDWFKKARAGLYGKNNDTVQAFACKNAGFFAMSLMYAAKALGLDTHPMDGFSHDRVVEEFQIPENYFVPLLLSVGYFDDAKELPAPKWRKTFEEISVRFDQ
ncbi:MAG: nitroreductase family protein [Desulfobacteraceae bacterium]